MLIESFTEKTVCYNNCIERWWSNTVISVTNLLCNLFQSNCRRRLTYLYPIQINQQTKFFQTFWSNKQIRNIAVINSSTIQRYLKKLPIDKLWANIATSNNDMTPTTAIAVKYYQGPITRWKIAIWRQHCSTHVLPQKTTQHRRIRFFGSFWSPYTTCSVEAKLLDFCGKLHSMETEMFT